MTIKFHCQYCGSLVQAPEESAGKRGKCPHCERSNFIPAAEGEAPLELAPLDEEEERRRQREVDRLLRAERDLLAETRRDESTPRLSQREPSEILAEDLHHMVINYCLDMFNGQLARAAEHVRGLADHPAAGRQAVSDFVEGRILEPVLDSIPVRVLQGYLKTLQKDLG